MKHIQVMLAVLAAWIAVGCAAAEPGAVVRSGVDWEVEGTGIAQNLQLSRELAEKNARDKLAEFLARRNLTDVEKGTYPIFFRVFENYVTTAHDGVCTTKVTLKAPVDMNPREKAPG
jgi:hypothetical protein